MAKKNINWRFVRECLAHRREKRDMAKAGFVEREILHPQLVSHMGKRVVDAIPSADGRRVFVRIVDAA